MLWQQSIKKISPPEQHKRMQKSVFCRLCSCRQGAHEQWAWGPLLEALCHCGISPTTWMLCVCLVVHPEPVCFHDVIHIIGIKLACLIILVEREGGRVVCSFCKSSYGLKRRELGLPMP